MRVRYLTCVIWLVAAASCRNSHHCQQDQGIRSFEDGNWPLAFEQLKNCESDSQVMAHTLGVLGLLYAQLDTFEGYEDRDPTDGARKSYDLWLRASKMGHKDSLDMLVSFHADGLDILGIQPNRKIYRCLDSLSNETSLQSANLSQEIDNCLASTN
jgi:hypothetical protein